MLNINYNAMLTASDLEQLAHKGITETQIEAQLKKFETGFPFLKLKDAASIENGGILAPTADECKRYIAQWSDYKNEGHQITKFVPASGAASRMFKNLFEFLDAAYEEPSTDFEKKFFDHIHLFAFYDDLNHVCLKNQGKDIDTLKQEGQYKPIVANLLKAEGLNYGQLPKGLLKFHKYDDSSRTPVEEHLVEAAQYAESNKKSHVHFTVSADHKELFKKLVDEKLKTYEERFGIEYTVDFSEQKASTDTIAATMENEPFRVDGKLLFRPGGHGALIENLNDLNTEIVFIKNIDNVVPDRLKADTVTYKQVIAGILVNLQKQAFAYLEFLDSGKYSHAELEEIIRFVQQKLCCRKEDIKDMEDADLVIYLRKKLNRPMRVCGVVKNVGEPGGGPFLAYNPDGTISLQILESSQIDTKNPEYMKMFTNGTHFNPVDLVCAVKDYKGKKFDLTQYVDQNTGFISYKSKNGKDLKALELPGLWNGAMSDWNTVFVEVPLSTFNPVKTVNDLLREQHQ